MERLRRIVVEVVPHNQQRYPTVGDWMWKYGGSVLFIRVSKMSDQRYEWLVLVHELVEVLLCRWMGISQEQVDEFDMQYEIDREHLLKDKHLGKAEKRFIEQLEPGDDNASPYRVPHMAATFIEKLVSVCLRVNWEKYNKEVTNL